MQLVGPLLARATAEGSSRRGVWVRGHLAGIISSSCRRCLKPLELEISEEFELLFDPKTSEADGDLNLYALDPEANELDLRETLRERFLLAIPAFPSCPFGCRGFCSRCGARLQNGGCDCGGAEPDPRWAPLEALRGRSGKSGA